jgi:RNA polymerase sigma factor (sigma-70 family)
MAAQDIHNRPDDELAKALCGTHSEAEMAFTELYGRHSQRVYAYLLRMTGDGAAAQDLLQDVFLKFYAAATQDLLVTNPGGFIFMTARNVCLNWIRDKKSFTTLEGLTVESFSDASTERGDLLELINLALELLDTELREAFILKCYQNYSYEQMSALTSETVDTLRNRVWRAKQKLRATLRSHILDIVNH